MLTFNQVEIAFGGRTLFSDASFSINDGEKIGLMGRNGTGKTSLLRCLLGELEPESGHIKKSPHYRIGYLQQHLHFTKDTVLEEACLSLPEDKAWDEWRAESLLMSLGFSLEAMLESPESFSGGWQIKIQLAKLLLSEPDLLLLDEPTNYLDITTIRWLKHMLQQWPHAFVLITHDRDFMDSIITHTLNIHRGQIKKQSGNSQVLLESIASQESLYEKQRISEAKKQQQTQAWIDRFKAKASMATRVQSKAKMLEKQGQMQKLGQIETLNFRFTSCPFQSKEPMLKARNLHFGYKPDRLLIEALSFSINVGDKIGIIGRNGQGKSTLLQIIAQLLEPLKGQISPHPKLELGYFGQMNRKQLNESLTVFQAMAKASDEHDETRIRKVCGQMLFTGSKADKPIKQLSGGEKSRVLLGKILLKPCNFLCLDEPTNHLDMYACEALCDALKQFEGGLCLVTHDEGMLNQLCNKLIVFDRDTVKFYHGDYQHFLDKIGWQDDQNL